MTVLPSLNCAICGRSVAPEMCTLDKLSAPVHKSCYAKKILMGEAAASADPPETHRGDRREPN